MLNNILKIFGDTFGIDPKGLEEIETSNFIDLSTKEGLDKFNSILDQIEKNVFSKAMMESLTGKKIFELRDLAQNYYDVCNKKPVEKESPKIEVKEIDHSNEEKIELPSSKLTTEQGLKLHKLVQEYIDTVIKPNNNGKLTNQEINDKYADLFEYSSWVLKK